MYLKLACPSSPDPSKATSVTPRPVIPRPRPPAPKAATPRVPPASQQEQIIMPQPSLNVLTADVTEKIKGVRKVT